MEQPFIPFDDLKVSTKTVMVYTNMEMNIFKLFRSLPYSEVENVPLTKKKKRPDIKKVRGPYRKLISVRDCYTLEHRGIVTKPDRSRIHILREKDIKGTITDEEMTELKKINISQKTLDFRHQLCCYMSLTKENGPILNINIMIFKSCFKIVGCKKDKYVYKIIKTLWGYIRESGHYVITDNYKPRFLFDFVMNNVSFFLGYNIQRKKLNNLMNRNDYKDVVKRSLFDSSGNTNINISFYSEVPETFRYLVYEFGENNKLTELYFKENIYKNAKKKINNPCVTLLAFRSSKTILTGRYQEEMKRVYHFFLDVVDKNRKYIEEVLISPDEEKNDLKV